MVGNLTILMRHPCKRNAYFPTQCITFVSGVVSVLFFYAEQSTSKHLTHF